VERAAERVEHLHLDRAAQPSGVDDEAAVVRAHEPLDPDVTGLAIHLDLGNFRDHGLTAAGVRNATPRQDGFASNPKPATPIRLTLSVREMPSKSPP